MHLTLRVQPLEKHYCEEKHACESLDHIHYNLYYNLYKPTRGFLVWQTEEADTAIRFHITDWKSMPGDVLCRTAKQEKNRAKVKRHEWMRNIVPPASERACEVQSNLDWAHSHAGYAVRGKRALKLYCREPSRNSDVLLYILKLSSSSNRFAIKWGDKNKDGIRSRETDKSKHKCKKKNPTKLGQGLCDSPLTGVVLGSNPIQKITA